MYATSEFGTIGSLVRYLQPRPLVRQQQKGEAYLTPEAVLAHYHGNTVKARQAMVEAEMDGRLALTYLLATFTACACHNAWAIFTAEAPRRTRI